jgi:uncharacterized protein (DUF2267 family)
MRTTKQLLRVAGLVAGVVGTVAATSSDTWVGRRARALGRRLERDVRYAVAAAPGLLYRLAGRRPDPDVSDDVLADRIRSGLGPLERRLDVPRVHVTVRDHRAILHGDVRTRAQAEAIEAHVARVSGVRGVESHLHVGLTPGETTPSQTGPPPPSRQLTALRAAAVEAGATEPDTAVGGVLGAFLDRLPAGEAEQVAAHLPADVRALLPDRPPAEPGARPARTGAELLAPLVERGTLPADGAEAIARAVCRTLGRLVPEEVADVAAVLPADLRTWWPSPAPA